MPGFILIGEKSSKLKDLDIFTETFNSLGLPLEKVYADDIAVISGETPYTYIRGAKTPPPDFIIPAFFGDNTYHNRSVVRMFESIGVLCINNCDCLINTGDKLKSFQLIKKHAPYACLPKTMLYMPSIGEKTITENFSFPIIVKIDHGAKGTGVSLAKNYDHLIDIIGLYRKSYNDEILLQEFISESAGVDLRIIICGGKYITSFKRINEKCFKSNLASGGRLEFFTPPDEIINTAKAVGAALNINLGSVDFLLGSKGRYYVCEANSMPGLSYVKAAAKAGLRNPLSDIAENIRRQVENHKSNIQ